jgi:hypothetical protein
MNVTFSQHALVRMAQREITRGDVQWAVDGNYYWQEDGRYHYVRYYDEGRSSLHVIVTPDWHVVTTWIRGRLDPRV